MSIEVGGRALWEKRGKLCGETRASKRANNAARFLDNFGWPLASFVHWFGGNPTELFRIYRYAVSPAWCSDIVRFVRMAKRQNSRSTSPAIYHMFVVLAVFSLAGSLVTRTFHLKPSYGTTAQSDAPHAVRQHLDRDAIGWAAPVPKFTPLHASTFHSRMATSGSPLPSPILDENLYNRPPPCC